MRLDRGQDNGAYLFFCLCFALAASSFSAFYENNQFFMNLYPKACSDFPFNDKVPHNTTSSSNDGIHQEVNDGMPYDLISFVIMILF